LWAANSENRTAGERINAIFWEYLSHKLADYWPVNPYNGHKGRRGTSRIFPARQVFLFELMDLYDAWVRILATSDQYGLFRRGKSPEIFRVLLRMV
jgi:hypothetical protein